MPAPTGARGMGAIDRAPAVDEPPSRSRADRSTWAGWDPEAPQQCSPRKEVIQPQLPLRLPCYDFVPITRPTLDASPLAVGPAASGVAGFRDVTGGVYKARERIHRGVLTRGY